MKNFDLAESHAISDKVEIDLHMLRALVLNRIARHIHSTNVVVIDDGGSSRRMM
jgi:hypothetical protein